MDKVAVSLTHEQALIEYDPQVASAESLLQTLKDIGYTISDPRKLRPFNEEEKALGTREEAFHGRTWCEHCCHGSGRLPGQQPLVRTLRLFDCERCGVRVRSPVSVHLAHSRGWLVVFCARWDCHLRRQAAPIFGGSLPWLPGSPGRSLCFSSSVSAFTSFGWPRWPWCAAWLSRLFSPTTRYG